MEAADRTFIKGLEYLWAARRNENPDDSLNADTHAREVLQDLAEHYREMAMELIMEGAGGAEGGGKRRPRGHVALWDVHDDVDWEWD